MSEPLWSWDALVTASGGRADVDANTPTGVGGISIDTRTIDTGDLFVALKDQRDGHDFITSAFGAGAGAALVADTYQRQPGDGALIRVGDTLKGLEAIAIAARNRLSKYARVVGVTGSVGKTGTKEMLRATLSRLGPTHAAEKSYNNHWGVPLTLARTPADAMFGVYEIGMNHAGEITPLVAMVRPHVAIVTTVEPVHLEFFDSVEDIARAKAEIFTGLVEGGTAIVNRDNAFGDILIAAAVKSGAPVVTFGQSETANVRAIAVSLSTSASLVLARLASGREIDFEVGVPGAHIAQNALGVVAVLEALDLDVTNAIPAMTDLAATDGRGARTKVHTADGRDILVIDESYNANPASMKAALEALGTMPRTAFKRRIAVLGDMLELGQASGELHIELKDAIAAAGVDLVFASGPNMRLLFDALPEHRRGAWAEKSAGIASQLCNSVRSGDAVMIKGSLGSRMSPLVDALKGLAKS
ncbi:MAG: UDP-N-acetylmuramoyl-tripeptide--D-alanyl-D-alanine ligase [Hyphomicrobiaceae bacterium]